MSTIVQYNHGAAGNVPVFAAAQISPDSGWTYFNDLFTLDGIDHTDAVFALSSSAGAMNGGVGRITDGATACYVALDTPIFGGQGLGLSNFVSFAARVKMPGRTAGDKFQFGLSTSIDGSTNMPSQVQNLCFEVVQGAAAAADTVECSFDDTANEREEVVTSSSIAGLSNFDTEAWFVLGAAAHRAADGSGTVSYHINGANIKTYRFAAMGDLGTSAFGFVSAANSGGLDSDSES
jgi:hypothetical protein